MRLKCIRFRLNFAEKVFLLLHPLKMNLFLCNNARLPFKNELYAFYYQLIAPKRLREKYPGQ